MRPPATMFPSPPPPPPPSSSPSDGDALERRARYKSRSARVGFGPGTTKLLDARYPSSCPRRVGTSSSDLPPRTVDATLIQDDIPATARDDAGDAPPPDRAECPPNRRRGVWSKAWCNPDPHSERSTEFLWVRTSGPMVAEKSDDSPFFLDVTTVV